MQSNATSGCEDSMLSRGVCSWEGLSQWDSTKAKVVLVFPRLNNPKMDTQSLEDRLLMVVRGCINGKDVAIMIDSRATHNFIAPQAVERLQLSTEENLSMQELADGSKFISEGECPNVLFTL